MVITDIYAHYTIPSHLQMHMLRVAAVAKYICEHMQEPIDTESTVTACLLHDMGNILKFNMSVRPDLLTPEGPEYWLSVQDDFKRRYGSDEHDATLAIMREVGVSDRVLEIFSLMGFSQTEQALAVGDMAALIGNYSDQRVGPDRVMLLRERLLEARDRYLSRAHVVYDAAFFDKTLLQAEHVEDVIFSQCSLTPSAIDDSVIDPLLESLRHTHI